jgi:hypothetical protein
VYPEVLKSLVREQYGGELTRKGDLLQRAAISAAVLAFVGNLIAYVALDFHAVPFRAWHGFFYVPFAGGIVCSAWALGQLGWFFLRGGQYAYLPSPKELVQYYVDAVAAGTAEEATTELEDNLIAAYADCATSNFNVNNERNGRIFESIRFSIVGLALCGVSLAPYLVMRLSYPAPTTSVTLQSPVEIHEQRTTSPASSASR